MTLTTAANDSTTDLKKPIALGTLVDLSKKMSPIRDEGSEGSVVGFVGWHGAMNPAGGYAATCGHA